MSQPFTGTEKEKEAVLQRIRARVQDTLAADDSAKAKTKLIDAQKPSEPQAYEPLPVSHIERIIAPGDPVYLADESTVKQWYFSRREQSDDEANPTTDTTRAVVETGDAEEEKSEKTVAWTAITPPRKAAAFQTALNTLIARYDEAKAANDTEHAGYLAELLEQYVAFSEIDAYISS